MVDLGEQIGRGSSFATDINSAGQVVGTLLLGDERLSWVWRKGVITIHRGGQGLHLTNSISDKEVVIGATFNRKLSAATMPATALPVPPPQGMNKFLMAALFTLAIAGAAVLYQRQFRASAPLRT